MAEARFAAPVPGNVLGYMIAGGRATRMGGVNKAAVLFNGTPMGALVVRALSGQCGTVWVSANSDQAFFLSLGAARVLPDRLGESAGPLAALEALDGELPGEFEWVLTAPCDVPCLPADMLSFFATQFSQTPAPLLTVRAGGHSHNTIALIHRSVLGTIRARLLAGDRKVGIWMQSQGMVAADWPGDPEVFCNVNDPGELKKLEGASH